MVSEDRSNKEESKREEQREIDALKKALAEETEKAQNYLANWQRAQADLANYKKRAEQERRETVELANAAVIANLLTVVDDFERALASLPDELRECKWVEGITLIYDKLKRVLQAEGVAEIEAQGKPFNPYLHEAVEHRDEKGEGQDIVVEVQQKGYRLKDRVIRPSMVVVGKESSEQRSEKEE